MAVTPVVEQLVITGVAQDAVDISGQAAGSFARITSIIISNGLTAGTLTIKQVQNVTTTNLTNETPIPASGSISIEALPRIFDLIITQNSTASKLTLESVGALSADINVTIYYFLHTP